jgi:hypothetical protein
MPFWIKEVSKIISTICESAMRAQRAIAPHPVKECYLGDEEYNAVMRYVDEQDVIRPHQRLPGWHVTICGARIRHLRELEAANQTARSVPSQHGEDQHD